MRWEFFCECFVQWFFGPDWFPDGSAVWLNIGPLRIGFERVDGEREGFGVVEVFAYA